MFPLKKLILNNYMAFLLSPRKIENIIEEGNSLTIITKIIKDRFGNSIAGGLKIKTNKEAFTNYEEYKKAFEKIAVHRSKYSENRMRDNGGNGQADISQINSSKKRKRRRRHKNPTDRGRDIQNNTNL